MKNIVSEINSLIEKKDFQKAKEILLSLYESCNEANENSKPEDENILKDKKFFIQKNLGLCNVNLNLFSEAILNFKNAIELNQKDATSWYYLGILFESANDDKSAENAYLKVIELRENFADAYKNLSIIYMKKRKMDKALDFAYKAKEYNPDDYQPYYIISSILIAKSEYAKVVEVLEKGIIIKPDHSNMQANLGSAYLETKNYDKAFEHLTKAVELDPKNIIAYNVLTNYYIALEDYKNAFEMMKKIYETEPSEVFLITLAMCAIKGELYEEAAKYYKTLAVLHPEKQHYKISLANAYIGMKDYKSAEDILFRIYQLNPKSEAIGLKLVECYKMSGETRLAVLILKKMISRGNISAEVRYDYAILSASLNDYDTALEELKKVVRLQSDNAIAHKDMAVIYLLRNQIDYAKEEFEAAYSIAPDSFSINFEYAGFLNQIQEFEKSKELYEKAIELSSGEVADVYLYAATNLISLNDIEGAYKYLIKANSMMEDNFDVLSNLGKVLFFMGKFKDSKEFCKKALTIKKDAETQNIYANSLMALNEFEEALQIFLELYELNKNNINLMLSITKCYYELNDCDNALLIAEKILAILPECEDAQKIIDKIKTKKEDKK